MTSTPVSNSTKQGLSNSSTPSPGSNVIQTAKKVKLPEFSTGSSSIIMSSASKVDSSYEDIVKAVLSEVTDQLKTTISENVKASVESMAQSVADIITTTLNDRITMIETDNRQL